MDSMHMLVVFLALVSIGLYFLGLMLALGIIQHLHKGKHRNPIFKAALWPIWIGAAVAEGAIKNVMGE